MLGTLENLSSLALTLQGRFGRQTEQNVNEDFFSAIK